MGRNGWSQHQGATEGTVLEGGTDSSKISWDFLGISGWVSLLTPSPAENWELLLAGLQTSSLACKHEVSVYSGRLPQ